MEHGRRGVVSDVERRFPSLVAVVALALPVVGLALLLARPELDVQWQHQPSHFWLVLATAALSVVLALGTNEAASRRADGRIILVSLAFLVCAGFLGLHALATPGVLLPEANTGFTAAMPVGLALAALLAAVATSPVAGPRAEWLLRRRDALRSGALLLLLAWAAVSLLRLPPLDGAPAEDAGLLRALALATVAGYGYAAWGFAGIARRRGSGFAIVIAAAFVLLAEAMLAVAFSRSWHLSWWEWHVLMTAAFALIAYGARREYRRTGSLVATFEPAYLSATLDRIDRWHGRAIADLAAGEEKGIPPDRLLADLRSEGASTDELALMQEAAREIRRIDELFRPYLPQAYAAQLRAEGGAAPVAEERTVSVLFADLAGFTTFSEGQAPMDVVAMLNAYWAAAVPVIDAEGGAIEHFAGDGILVQFGAVTDQPDHAPRAARAALELLRVTDALAAGHVGWPRFRVGINTGPAVVGTIGAAGRHSLATIGDTTNLGSRLAGVAEPGQAVIGATTRAALEAAAGTFSVRALGQVSVKGKREPVEAWVLGPGQPPMAT
jgi:class 3 adenylate cyclase